MLYTQKQTHIHSARSYYITWFAVNENVMKMCECVCVFVYHQYQSILRLLTTDVFGHILAHAIIFLSLRYFEYTVCITHKYDFAFMPIHITTHI